MSTQAQPTGTSVQRFAYLDVVRGLAALSVVATHVFEQGIPGFKKFAGDNFNLGLLGVLLFFIVSGTVISASIERSRNLKDFWLQRFWRLYPTYWVSLICATLLFLAFPTMLEFAVYGHLKDRFWLSFGVNMTMLQSFAGIDNFIPAYWTLGFEMFFYMALASLALVKFEKRAHHLLWALSGLILVAGIVGLLKGSHVGSYKFILCGYFWLGIWVHRMLKGDVSAKQFWTMLVAFQACVFVSWYSNFNLHPAAAAEAYSEFPYSPQAMLVAFLGSTAIFLAFLSLRERAFPRPFITLGAVSYSLYLFHPIAMTLVGIGFNNHYTPVQYIISTGTLTAIITALAYKFVEVPSLRKVKSVKLAAKG